MAQIRYHRITDWNGPLDGSDRRVSFEAGFNLSPEQALTIHGRVIDSAGLTVLSSMNPLESGPEIGLDAISLYRRWHPEEALAGLVQAVESQSIEGEAAYFGTPLCELTLEVRGPIAHRSVFGLFASMAGSFTLPGGYRWASSGHISVGLLCEAERLLAFLKGLQQDLAGLRGQRPIC